MSGREPCHESGCPTPPTRVFYCNTCGGGAGVYSCVAHAAAAEALVRGAHLTIPHVVGRSFADAKAKRADGKHVLLFLSRPS